jgi:uncharacterized protein (TIGR02996 family)
MPDEAAFIQTIREHPDDDGPRLVYADWLEERGECDRAEFIRVQIELARGVKNGHRQQELKEREAKLLNKHERQWIRSAAKGIRGSVFRRGMLESIEIPVTALRSAESSLFKRAPILQLKLRTLDDDVGELTGCAALAMVRHLDLSANCLSAAQLQRLLSSPYLDQLQSLDLSMNNLGNEGMRLVSHCAGLVNLVELGLSGTGLRGGTWIRGFRRMPRLVTLRLGSNLIGDAAVQTLARSASVKSLHRLDLSHCVFGSDGAAALAGSKHLTHLTELDLSANRIGDAGAESLANSALLNGLEVLLLRDADIGWTGAKALAQSQLLHGLRRLDLGRNRLNLRQMNRLELRFGARVEF